MTTRILFLVSVLMAGAAQQQPQQPPPPAPPAPVTPMTPSPPHEKLAMFEGTWTLEEMPAAQAFRETCAWMPLGRRHMVCRSTYKTTSGQPREGMSVMSYRPADGMYVHQGFSPSGVQSTVIGKPSEDGTRWQFDGDEGTGDARVRTRVRIEALADGRVRFSEQTAKGSGEWSAPEVVTYRRIREPQPPAPAGRR